MGITLVVMDTKINKRPINHVNKPSRNGAPLKQMVGQLRQAMHGNNKQKKYGQE